MAFNFKDEPKPFLDHLEDLRRTILSCLGALVVGMAIAMPFAPKILELIKQPVVRAGKDPETFLLILEVAGGMSLFMRVAFWGGLIIAAPGVIYFICKFIFPGLLPKERKALSRSSGAAVVLFIGGVAMGYSFCHYALLVFFKVSAWMNAPVSNVLLVDYVSFVLKLLLGFGLAFELPVILYLLGVLGLVDSNGLREYRRHAIVVIFIIAMVLTPPDVLTQLIMGVPMYLLYEAAIWLVWLHEKRNPEIPDDTSVVEYDDLEE